MANTRSTASNWRLLLTLVLSTAACWLTQPHASAHAAYESSTPEFAEVLSGPPTEISIRFTQELFRREGANGITLTRLEHGNKVRLGEVKIANDDRHVMTVSINEDLEAGRFLVSWTNLSAEDGDTDSGSFPFYVRRSPSATEVAEDRRSAAELLIVYPGDETDQSSEAEAAPRGAPTVVRAESSNRAGLDVGPIVWMVVGIAAGLFLVGALGFHLGRSRSGR